MAAEKDPDEVRKWPQGVLSQHEAFCSSPEQNYTAARASTYQSTMVLSIVFQCHPHTVWACLDLLRQPWARGEGASSKLHKELFKASLLGMCPTQSYRPQHMEGLGGHFWSPSLNFFFTNFQSF